LHWLHSTSLALLLLVVPVCAETPLDLSPLRKWFARQDEVHSVAADFVQTRALKVLRDPVATPGRLWFVPPTSLRWELGSPAKTIVLRQGETFLLVFPAKKKAERHPVADAGLALPRFPLAKSFADFQRQFEVLTLTTAGERCHTELASRDPQTRKFLTALRLDFNPVNGHLLAFEMALRDGSSMRNEFSNVRVNQKIDRAVFNYDLTGFEVKDARD
jgi:outer membrane lipoprotein-sorting protein